MHCAASLQRQVALRPLRGRWARNRATASGSMGIVWSGRSRWARSAARHEEKHAGSHADLRTDNHAADGVDGNALQAASIDGEEDVTDLHFARAMGGAARRNARHDELPGSIRREEDSDPCILRLRHAPCRPTRLRGSTLGPERSKRQGQGGSKRRLQLQLLPSVFFPAFLPGPPPLLPVFPGQDK